jgi:hypothetical protein
MDSPSHRRPAKPVYPTRAAVESTQNERKPPAYKQPSIDIDIESPPSKPAMTFDKEKFMKANKEVKVDSS